MCISYHAGVAFAHPVSSHHLDRLHVTLCTVSIKPPQGSFLTGQFHVGVPVRGVTVLTDDVDVGVDGPTLAAKISVRTRLPSQAYRWLVICLG